MGTGGGDFLAEISSFLTGRVVATEEWKVNAPVAKKRLSTFSFEVIRCRSVELPFKARSFDLVLNRHEDLDPKEVARVLSPGGRVITQQVDRDNWKEMRKFFPRMTDFGDLRGNYARAFESSGLKIVSDRKCDYKVAYQTLGDLVFMLMVTPWTVPDFNLDNDIDSLLLLDNECHTAKGIELTESRFLLIADKTR
jgi:SAM-dependent methyltransferase